MSPSAETPATEVLRYAAFTVDGGGGNPAGVVLDARRLGEETMLGIAADLGYSETAFLFPTEDPGTFDVRYFAPQQEVPFCGHATIATAVAIAERQGPGPITLQTRSGPVPVLTRRDGSAIIAELTSVAPWCSDASPALVADTLSALRWAAEDLDPGYPPAIAYAGARHLVLLIRTRQRLADLDYDFDRLAALMREHDLVTVALVWPESPDRYHARNPFAGSGVVEDPATGAAAAALGGYLRRLGKVPPDATFTVVQGVDMGRPSELAVRLVAGEAGVRVSGTASPIAPAS